MTLPLRTRRSHRHRLYHAPRHLLGRTVPSRRRYCVLLLRLQSSRRGANAPGNARHNRHESTRQSVVAGVWSGGVAKGKSRRFAGPARAMGVTAGCAVAQVGGYLLSVGVDNEERGEEEKIEKLKDQGLYEKPEPTQYEDQGVATRTRKRRISEE